MIPPVLPLPIGQDKVQEVKKSASPILNDRTLDELYKYLDANLNRFKRRSFEEFSYIKVEPKMWQIIMIYIIALLVSVGINLWATNNEFHDEDGKGKNQTYKKRRGRYDFR